MSYTKSNFNNSLFFIAVLFIDISIHNLSSIIVLFHNYVICKSTHPETTSLWWCHLQNIQARLPRWLSFLQHILWRCCNPLGILSSMVGILLFNLVFHDRVTPISVSTLKPPLGVIGVLPMKPWASPILSVCI